MVSVKNSFRAVACVLCLLLVLATTSARTHGAVPAVQAKASLAGQGWYVVAMLDTFAGQYWARVAGRDTGLPPGTNGHDEFAARWTHEVLANLHGLPTAVLHQQFAVPGFSGLPARRPGDNIVVLVPGSRYPEQSVVVGAHYDGEPFSKGSAYDDASGSMIVLGLARELGAAWRAHGLPSRSMEFVLFDAEEQGLIGSNAYTFALRHGGLMPRPVFMLNEEQSGVGYPVRPFGLLSGAPLPMFATTTAQLSRSAQHLVGPAQRPNPTALKRALVMLDGAVTSAFSALHAAYPTIAYRGGNAPAFGAGDRSSVVRGPNPALCCSDEAPFEALGLPTVTLSGDYHYYEQGSPSWAYPFDQPQDTPTALACDTGGSSRPGSALAAALNLELQVSIPLVDGYAPAGRGTGVAVASDVPGAGLPMHIHAVGGSNVRWAFGDGATARGNSVEHTYRSAGTYRLSMESGGHITSYELTIPAKRPVFSSGIKPISPPPIIPWHPAELRGVQGCP